MKIENNTGLVLEGGGMRGVFTSGVLDAFMKYGLFFDYVVALSHRVEVYNRQLEMI